MPARAMKVGRNQPCPCGSGKKYKLCCLHSDNARVTGSVWRRMRGTEGKLGPLLGSHAVEHYGPQSLIEAWDEFTLWEDVPLDFDEPMLEFETAFQSWWVYQWIPDNTKRLGELRPPEMPVALHYLAKRGTRMDAFTRRFIEEACSQPFSFFIVRDVTPGARMSIRDLLSKREFEVYERRASQELEKGSIIFSQVVTLDGNSILLGVAPYVIPPSYAGLFLDMREDLAFDGLKGVDLLSEWDFELRETYFDIRSDLLDPQLPALQNTDGDPFQLIALHYELRCTPQEARDALAPLALDLGDRRSPATDAAGELVAVSFPWVREDIDPREERSYTTLGEIEIDGTRMTAEVSSERRSEAFKQEVERRLGDRAEFRDAVVTSPEELIDLVQEIGDDPDETSTGTEGDGTAVRGSLEARSLLAETPDDHWVAWLDASLPVLNDATPREAARTELGRERLEALLWHLDWINTGLPHEPDVDRLREELGIG